MENKNLAPIILFTYNRLEHTKKTINSLKKNLLAKKSELYVFSDAPKKNNDSKKIEEVRIYLEQIKGFKKTHIIKRDKNYGVSKNLIDGVTEIIDKYGKAIILEDDDVPSKYFLKYMNDSLNIYYNDKRVGAISSFVFPSSKKLPETYFLKFFNSWGWGTWEDRWVLFEYDGNKLLSRLKKKKLVKLFNLHNTYPFSRILRNQIRKNNDSWSVRWYASLFLKKKLTLFPKKSLIENTGFGSEGEHCQNGWYENTEVYNKEIKIKKIPISQNQIAYKEIQKYFRSIFWRRLSMKIKRVIRNPIKEFGNL